MIVFNIGNDCWLLIVLQLSTFREWMLLRLVNKFFRDLLDFETCWKHWKNKIHFNYYTEPKSFIDWEDELRFYHRLTHQGPRSVDITKEHLEYDYMGTMKNYRVYIYNGVELCIQNKKSLKIQSIASSTIYGHISIPLITEHHLFYTTNMKEFCVYNESQDVELISIPEKYTEFQITDSAINLISEKETEIWIPKSISEKEYAFEKKQIDCDIVRGYSDIFITNPFTIHWYNGKRRVFIYNYRNLEKVDNLVWFLIQDDLYRLDISNSDNDPIVLHSEFFNHLFKTDGDWIVCNFWILHHFVILYTKQLKTENNQRYDIHRLSCLHSKTLELMFSKTLQTFEKQKHFASFKEGFGIIMIDGLGAYSFFDKPLLTIK